MFPNLFPIFAAASTSLSLIFIELGLLVIGIGLLTRLASRMGFSAIPLYLIAGLCFGNGGIAPLRVSGDFVHVGGEIGVLLLLFMLGLEYTGEDLQENLRVGLPAGIVDFALNFPPGLLTGFLLGWPPIVAVLLGGVTYISSSGIIAKVLGELGRMKNSETPTVLSVLVLEDLAMAVYLPLVAVLLVGQSVQAAAISVGVALCIVFVALFVAIRYSGRISRMVAHQSDEVVLFLALGLVLVVAGAAQYMQVSAAIGAFLTGVALGGSVAERAHRLVGPLRDLFAAIFFLFFGLQINPATLPPVLLPALLLAVVTTITKVAAGYWAARRANVDKSGSLRAGATLVARGEFSIVIAGLGAAIEPRLGALSAAYVLILAVVGPILARLSGRETGRSSP